MKEKRDNEAEHIEGRLSKNERIERLLNSLYDFRFNIVKSRTEYRVIHASGLYQPVTKFALNSFRRKLDVTAGVATSAENIRMILESDFVSKVHPIREYLTALPLLNPAGHGYIKKLLNTVQVANPGKWEEYFTKWLVGVVANAMNDTGCQNHTCLVLTGDKQGQFKTWWLDNLCPSPLKNYLFTGKIEPQSKDILTLIAEYLFINIDDQLKELNKQNENALKNLITTPAVKYRRPYDIYIEEYPHLASFMASVIPLNSIQVKLLNKKHSQHCELLIFVHLSKKLPMKQINIVFQLPYKTQYLKLYHLYISFHPVVTYKLQAIP